MKSKIKKIQFAQTMCYYCLGCNKLENLLFTGEKECKDAIIVRRVG